MAEERRESSGRDRRPTADADGVVRLTRQGDHLVPAHLSAALPTRPVTTALPPESDANLHPALLSPSLAAASDPVVAFNRARLQALHQMRESSPAVADAFFSWLWIFFLFIGVGAATQVFLDLRILWAAGVGVGVNCVAIFTFCELLDRHERAIIRRAGGTLAPRTQIVWRDLSPPRVWRRARAHLAALTIDDSGLEDQLDALVRPGCDSYDLRPQGQPLGAAPRRRQL